MKLSTAAVILACTNTCAKEQHITPRSRGGDRNLGDDPEQKNKFILTDKDVKEDSRGQYTRKPIKSNNKSENEEILVDSSSLPPKKMHNKKSERFGIPSNEKEAEPEYHETEQAQIAAEYAAETSDIGVLSDGYPSTHTRLHDRIMSGAEPGYLTNQGQEETPVDSSTADGDKLLQPDHRDEIVLSVPQDVIDRQAQSQGRRLDALQAFKDRCEETSGLSGSAAYVDCVDGQELDLGNPTGHTCATACDGKCCVGVDACDDFTGKVCRDGSCDSIEINFGFACHNANIGYVVGPSCTGGNSCDSARIGIVDSSCKDDYSCFVAQLSGADLINSCNAFASCTAANANGAIAELIDCCNDDSQCQSIKDGLDIVADGCPAPTSMPSQSFVPSQHPSESPSSSSAPSQQPSESSEPSLAPSNSPRVTSLTVIEPDGVSKTVNCCESGDDNNECQDLLAIAEAESLDECVATSTSEQPSLVPSTHPSVEPSIVPSDSGVPSLMPSETPSLSNEPTTLPSQTPSSSSQPSSQPSSNPTSSGAPSLVPSDSPTLSTRPSSEPSSNPSTSAEPSAVPSNPPSSSVEPSNMPSEKPSVSTSPSVQPSTQPSFESSTVPSKSGVPSLMPSERPSTSSKPSNMPSSLPSSSPVMHPSTGPSSSISPSTSIQPSTECTDQLERLKAKLNASEEPTSTPSNLPSSSSLPSSSTQPSSSSPTCQQNEPTKTGQEYLEDALQSLSSSASGLSSLSSSTFGKGGKGKIRSAQRLIMEAIESNNVFEKIPKASSASETLECDDPRDQDEDTCELLSLAISDFALNGYVPNNVPSSKGSKGLSNTMSNNSSSGKGKESSKFDSINMSSMTEVWEYSTSDWSLASKKKALISIILKEVMDYKKDDELN